MRKLLLVSILVFSLSAVSYAQPSIMFDAETYDFGTVTSGETLEHTFVVTNTGDKELIIEKLIPSWGCAAALASSSHIGPGEKGMINTKINITGRKGAIHKNVQVLSNDPQKPKANLSIKALIQ